MVRLASWDMSMFPFHRNGSKPTQANQPLTKVSTWFGSCIIYGFHLVLHCLTSFRWYHKEVPAATSRFSATHFFWLLVNLPLWKIWQSVGVTISKIWKKTTCSKPPTRHTLLVCFFLMCCLLPKEPMRLTRYLHGDLSHHISAWQICQQRETPAPWRISKMRRSTENCLWYPLVI